jgi:integrase
MSKRSKKKTRQAPLSPKPEWPAFCLHKRSGRAYVKLNGKQMPLGKHGTNEAWKNYLRTMAEWEANGRQVPGTADAEALQIQDLCADYIEHATTYYRREDGTQTGQVDNVCYSLKLLLELYGDSPIARFDRRALKAVREQWIEGKLARSTINARVQVIQRMFAWAVDEDMIPETVASSVALVRSLPRHRSRANEPPKREPVPEAVFRAVLPHVRPRLRALLIVLWLTAARLSEVAQIRRQELTMKGDVWEFDPPHAKNRHRGKDCRIFLGADAQNVLAPFMKLERSAYWLSPADDEADRQVERRKLRRTPLKPSDVRRMAKRSTGLRKRPPGEQFDSHAVTNALRRACIRAGVPRFTAHQIRHAALSRMRAEYGIEVAQAVGGHSSLTMTEHYTEEARRRLAQNVARKEHWTG